MRVHSQVSRMSPDPSTQSPSSSSSSSSPEVSSAQESRENTSEQDRHPCEGRGLHLASHHLNTASGHEPTTSFQRCLAKRNVYNGLQS